jgi:hypothetical protein
MSFYSPYTTAPKVLVSETEIVEYVYVLSSPSATEFTRSVTTLEYEYRGLTSAAKDSCLTAEALNGNNPRATHLQGGNGWNVTITDVTFDSWVATP